MYVLYAYVVYMYVYTYIGKLKWLKKGLNKTYINKRNNLEWNKHYY